MCFLATCFPAIRRPSHQPRPALPQARAGESERCSCSVGAFPTPVETAGAKPVCWQSLGTLCRGCQLPCVPHSEPGRRADLQEAGQGLCTGTQVGTPCGPPCAEKRGVAERMVGLSGKLPSLIARGLGDRATLQEVSLRTAMAAVLLHCSCVAGVFQCPVSLQWHSYDTWPAGPACDMVCCLPRA